MFDWPFKAENSLVIAGWGFWLSIGGLLLTIIGFGITWYQIIKTKGAAEAAKQEILRIQMAINTYDAAQEISKAVAALDGVRRHLRNKAWADVADGYEVFRRSINNVSALSDALEEGSRLSIIAANKYIVRLLERIENGIEAGNVDIEQSKTLTVMRQHDELAGHISLQIQKGVIQ